jgi:integrase
VHEGACDLRDGRDPALEFNTKIQRRKITASHESKFASVAEAWHSRQVPRWKERHADDVIHSLRRDVFPIIGEMDVRLIRAGDIRDLLLDVQERGALETAHRLLQRISSVFQYAIAFELTEFDPTAGVSLVLQKVIKRKQPAALSIDQARDFLRAFERIPAHPSTKLASRLLALTAARPGMVQMAQPGEFKDLDGPSRTGACLPRR